MTGDEYGRVRAALRALPAEEQCRLALSLADLALPFATLSREGQPARGLPAVAAVIRDDASDLPAIEAARHELWSVPELREQEEPSGAAWYSLGATVAWIYAADARLTGPSDGVANTLSRVADLLDQADDQLGDTRMVESLLRALAAAVRGEPGGLAALLPDVEAAVRRLSAGA